MGIILAMLFAIFILVILGERLLRSHRFHRLLWATCTNRTNTSYQRRFTRLQHFWTPRRSVIRPPNESDIVTFDFSEAHKGSLTIEIPAKSGWHTLRHTHMQSESCNAITTVTGRWVVGSATWATPGPAPPEKPRLWSSMGRLDSNDNGAATARLSGTVASRVLDHLICSLVQDAEVYLHLCTTPAWIRVLNATIWSAPRLKEILVRRLLWVQLRATLHVHDFVEDHGTITIFRWINPWSPPAWVHRFEERMRFVKSRAVSGCNYWLGRNVLGMNVRYKEYVLIWAEDEEQK